MTFARSFDYDAIREVMTHEKLYDVCGDDFQPAREAFEPRTDAAIWYVMAHDGDVLLGLFAIAPQNAICYELHSRILPEAWGPLAREALKGIIQWTFANTPALRIVTFCPSYNRLAVKIGLRVGFTEYGVNPKSWMKGGKLWDQILMGISKQ